MKRLIALLIILLPLTAVAQTTTFEDLAYEYSLKENCTTIKISNAMLRSMEINIDAEYMRVIAVEDEDLIPIFSRQAKEIICQHDVIMSVNADGKCVEIYQHKNSDNVVTEIYVLACDKEEAVLMYVNGKNLELNNMGSILNQF